MIRRNITKTITLCLLTLAIVGCNQRKGNDTYTVNADRAETSASEGKADTTQRVPDATTTGTSKSLTAKEDNKRKADRKLLADLKRRTVSKYFANCDSDTLTVGRARLAVPSGAMTRPRVLSITPLKKGEIAQLPAGMVNVTGNCGSMMSQGDTVAGYRFLPHGNHFSHHLASITVPYDSTLIPKGYTVDDIHTYFYDEMKHQWTMLRSTGVDKEQEVAMAETSHFTDVINGIIKVPESPETQNYVPTGIKDLKAADPSAGIQQIEAPTANQNGTASISYPFETPKGRNDIAASAGLQYSSDGGSSYVGYGWSLPVTSIDIETRWGVPRFDKKYESESYLLMGQQLNDRLYRRTDSLKREDNKQFYPMVEGSFNKIIRKGNSPEDYYWEVTAKDGTVYRYGGSEETSLRDAKNNRIKWALERITDVHGNFAAFHYQKFGNNLYPSKYTWTGYKDKDKEEEGLFSIEFEIDSVSAQRVDVTKNGRLGLLQTDAALLKKVVVKNNGQQLRAYKPNYEEGPFGKTLLKSIDQLDSKDNLVASQNFEYYNDVKNGLFADDVITYTAGSDNYGKLVNKIGNFDDRLSLLGGGSAKGNTVGGGLMVGAGWGPATANAGFSYSYSKSNNEGRVAMVDINGDGLPDKVWKGSDGKLYYRQNLRLNQNEDSSKDSFGKPIEIKGVNSFSTGTTASKTLGVEVATGFGPLSAGYSTGNTTERTETKTYFHDFNGDGLIDIAKNGTVYFNHSDGENVSFTTTSENTGNPIISGNSAKIDSLFLPDYDLIRDSLKQQYPLHDIVRLWRAPYAGDIKIESSVIKPSSEGDGVWLCIQYNDKIKWIDSLMSGKKDIILSIPRVKAGHYILFRVGAKNSGTGDIVEWDPRITYTSILVDSVAGDDIRHYQSSKDYIPGEASNVALTVDGKVPFKGKFEKEKTSDDVILAIQKTCRDKIMTIDSLIIPADSVVTGDFIGEIQSVAKDSATVDFIIKSDSPINWQKIRWKPEVQIDTVKYTMSPQRLMFNKNIVLVKDSLVKADLAVVDSTWEAGFSIVPSLKVGRLSDKDKDTATVNMTIKDDCGTLVQEEVCHE